MASSLLATLLQNLLHINVLTIEKEANALAGFEAKYCYNGALQPVFTAEILSELIEAAQNGVIYGLQDDLGICIQFFRFDSGIFLVGPYVKRDFDANRAQSVLIRHHIPASFASSVRLYYSAFPILSTTQIRETITACARSLSGCVVEFVYCRLHNEGKHTVMPEPLREESLDYSTLYQRYDQENRFLRMIETGDTEHVLIAFREMGLRGLGGNRYINAVYQDPAISLSMTRALARKAAERGGAALVDIHEITQRAVQGIYAAKHTREMADCTERMLVELTEAVRKSRDDLGSYSEPIRAVLSYIQHNSSQEIRLETLTEVSGLSEGYWPRAFKKEVGLTVSQYLARLRCNQAAELLRTSRLSVQEVSSYVGYEDNNYFVKVFKKEYGMTPSDFRRHAGDYI